MNCKNIDKYIIKYCEKTLSPMEQKKLFEHLISCDECMESFNCCVELYENNNRLYNRDTPSDFTENLMDKIDFVAKDENKKKTKRERYHNSFLIIISLLITSFALLIVHRNVINGALVKNHYFFINNIVNNLNIFFNNIFLYLKDFIDIINSNSIIIKIVSLIVLFLVLINHKKINF